MISFVLVYMKLVIIITVLTLNSKSGYLLIVYDINYVH